jgi:hypothetical protein
MIASRLLWWVFSSSPFIRKFHIAFAHLKVGSNYELIFAAPLSARKGMFVCFALSSSLLKRGDVVLFKLWVTEYCCRIWSFELASWRTPDLVPGKACLFCSCVWMWWRACFALVFDLVMRWGLSQRFVWIFTILSGYLLSFASLTDRRLSFVILLFRGLLFLYTCESQDDSV